MKVVVDRTRCVGHGICEALVPGMFRIGTDGDLIHLREEVDESEMAAVEDAVASCPTDALLLSD